MVEGRKFNYTSLLPYTIPDLIIKIISLGMLEVLSTKEYHMAGIRRHAVTLALWNIPLSEIRITLTLLAFYKVL